jgi:hypothetical protein
MGLTIDTEQALLNEAISILLDHMPADKVARVVAAWNVGSGDFTKLRHAPFADMDADALMDELEAHEAELLTQAAAAAA